MMLDKIAMITFLIIMIIFGLLIVITLYITILGDDIGKTPKERKFEDDEQMKYLKIYKNKKRGSRKSDRTNT